MNEEQINDLFTTLVSGLRAAGNNAGGSAAPEVREEVVTPPSPDELKKYFDPSHAEFNPQKGVAIVAEFNYGPLLKDISGRATNGLYQKIAADYPDFRNFEKEVENALKGVDPRTISEKQIFGTYLTLKGLKQVQAERAAAAKAAGTGTLTGSGTGATEHKDDDAGIVLSDFEIGIAKKMFPNATDPVAAYKEAAKRYESRTTVKVPTGRDASGKMEMA